MEKESGTVLTHWYRCRLVSAAWAQELEGQRWTASLVNEFGERSGFLPIGSKRGVLLAAAERPLAREEVQRLAQSTGWRVRCLPSRLLDWSAVWQSHNHLGWKDAPSLNKIGASEAKEHDLRFGHVDPVLRRMVPRRFAEGHLLVPLKTDSEKGILQVAVSDPEDLVVTDLLRRICGERHWRLQLVPASPEWIRDAIRRVYDEKPRGRTGPVMVSVALEESVRGDGLRPDLISSSENPQIRQILNSILYRAVVEGASDIHVENLESEVRTRFRIDGILQLRETRISKRNVEQVVSVLKIDAGLDITERRRPQDGVIKKRIGDDWHVDFRLHVHRSQFGSDAVIRILDTSRKLPHLGGLGLSSELMGHYLEVIQNPQGLILITGPTGSGKSTTLYSTLSYLNTLERKIVTAEDPVEYHLDGICQYGVNEAIGNTFSEYARRFLRKDPDIILIGEIRDEITAEACLRAAQTGHLVFSTLHTNHTTAAVSRLRDLGAQASGIADALLAVLAQRLIRTNCVSCLEEYRPSDELLQRFFPRRPLQKQGFLRGRGCDVCFGTGFSGRTGVFELWQMDAKARKEILDGVLPSPLRSPAPGEGPQALILDALDKVSRGLTTLEEVKRVIPFEMSVSLLGAPEGS